MTDGLDLQQPRHREFLEHLASDDDLRAELQREPAAVLTRYGVAFIPENLPAVGEVQLPSKEDVQSHFDEYLDKLRDDHERWKKYPGENHFSPHPVFVGSY